MKRPLNRLEERLLLALHRDIHTTGALIASIEIDRRKFYTIIGTLEKYGYIKSLGYATWALTVKGSEYITTYLDVATGLPFENTEVQDFLTRFPEPYQGVLRLTLSCCVAKRTKLFDAFKAGFPGTLLVGEAGIGKSPIGDTVSWLQGKDPSEVKIDARLLTKGEIAGRLERDPNHKGKWRLNPSYWQKQDYAQIEEIDKVINRDVSGIIKVIAHAEKDFIREGKKYPNRTVPFLTMNIEGKQGQVALDKIHQAMGIPFIKRNNILFCNPYKGYLDDPAKFFREVLGETPKKIVPALSLNIPILKTELSNIEFDLLARLIKEGMLPGIDNSHCDKRGVGIEVLAFHALTGDKDITSATYQIVKDRLWCLESLALVRPGWRSWYNREWLEYVEKVDPGKAPAIREAIKRQEELEASIPVIDLPGIKHGETVDLKKRHGAMLDSLRNMRDFLDFPLTSIKQTVLPLYIVKELCARYKKKHEGLRRSIKIEIETLDPITEDNIGIGERVVLEFQRKDTQHIESAFNNDLNSLETQWTKEKVDEEKKKDVVKEIEKLISDLWKADLWATTRSVFVKDAIRNLREKSERLRSKLQTALKQKKVLSLSDLQWKLKNAYLESRPWFDEFEEEGIDPGAKMIETGTDIASDVTVGVYKAIASIKNFFKGKGEKRPPTKPRDDLDSGGGLDIGKTLGG